MARARFPSRRLPPSVRRPLEVALSAFLTAPLATDDFDRDTLATVARHFIATVLQRRLPGLVLLHYADMLADPRRAIRRLAEKTGIEAGEPLIEAIATATAFEAMRARAERFVPQGGTGFWQQDAAFFDSGGTGKWRGQLDEADLELYRGRLAQLVPDQRARRWLELGGSTFRPG